MLSRISFHVLYGRGVTLKTFITDLENQLSLKVKVIRSDNGTEFKNYDLNQFCGMKGMKREFSVPRTPQQNGVTKRKNRTLIEAARTMIGAVTKSHNKTPYELLHGRTPSIGFMRPFSYPVTILNTLDSLGKFEGKVDEGFLVGYSVSSKAFRVFNSRTRIVQETLHVNFLVNKPNVAGSGPTWLFDIDSLTRTMNYQPAIARNQTNPSAGFQDKFDAEKAGEEINQQYMLFPCGLLSRKQDDKTKKEAKGKSPVESFTRYRDLSTEFEDCFDNSSNEVNAAGSIVPIVRQNSFNNTNPFSAAELEDITYSDDENNVGAEADFNNLEPSITIKVYFHRCLMMTSILACLLDFFHMRNPKGNKKDERGIVVRNKARLIAQEHTHEEGIDYEEVFALVARIKAIRLFLAYASFMGFMVYQMDVKSAFLYGTIKEEVYVFQPLGFEDPDHPDKVYKVARHFMVYIKLLELDNIIFGATNKDLCKSFEKLMKDKFHISSMGELTFFLGLQVKQKKDGIFISQDKYIAEILRKFRLTKEKSASTPIDTEKPLLKDPDDEDVDVHTYRSMIGSLVYLTSLKQDIMFAVCACTRFQVTPKASHLHAVKRIFRYLKGKPHLGLWYLKDSPFHLVAYSDIDYAGASLDRKSTTRGCQFLGCRLISWQCKKQTVVATSSTEAEYVAVASCCVQVIWI
nr:putative ribonuclease H-like domain-containing protein [Tanacetum cinerariifolium]